MASLVINVHVADIGADYTEDFTGLDGRALEEREELGQFLVANGFDPAIVASVISPDAASGSPRLANASRSDPPITRSVSSNPCRSQEFR